MSKVRYGLEPRSAVRVRRLRQVRTAAAMVALLLIVLGYLVVQGVRAERDWSSQQAANEETLPLDLATAQKLAAETPLATEPHSLKGAEVADAPTDASSVAFVSSQTAVSSLVGDLPPQFEPASQQALNTASGGVGGGHGMPDGAPSMSGYGGGGGFGGAGGGGGGGGSRSAETATGSTTGKPNLLGKKYSDETYESSDTASSANSGSNDRNGDGNGNNGSNGNGVSHDRNGDGNGNNGKNADNGSNGGNGGTATNHENASNGGTKGGDDNGDSNIAGAPPANAAGVDNLGLNEGNGGDITSGDPLNVPEPGSMILLGIGSIAALARRRAR